MIIGVRIESVHRLSQQRLVSKINLIDLAGSERCNKSRLKAA